MIREIGKMLGDLQIENDKLKTCLTEIKEIAEKIVDSYIRPYGDYDELKQILQKISECEGNDGN